MPNVVTENNFINSKIDIQIYGQLELDRNYWSNYEALYPDAKEIGDTGIWDTSYDTGPHAGRLLFFDSNPLINHIVSAGAPGRNEKPTPVPTFSPSDKEPQPPLTTILIVTIVSVTIVSISLSIYFKKKK